MDPLEHFTLVPLTLDPTTKALSSPHPTPSLTHELSTLNTLHRALLTLDTPAPPPPLPIKPQRSQAITKLRDTAHATLKKNATEAIKLYTLALDMALQRPPWEPAGLVREEASALYSARAGAHIENRDWADAWTDVRLAVEAKRAGGMAKAWVRGVRCLVEMGRTNEARTWAAEGEDAEDAALAGVRQQMVQAGANVPPQAREQVKGFERDLEELKEVRRGLEGGK